MFRRIAEEARHMVRSTVYSLKGLQVVARQETAFRQELLVLVIVLPLAIWLGRTGVERALLIGSWMLVLVVEMLNSSIETIVNRISMEHHELSGVAKDLGSAAVFSAIVVAMVVWLLVLAGP